MKLQVLRDRDGTVVAAVELRSNTDVEVEPLTVEGQTLDIIEVSQFETRDVDSLLRR